MINSEKNSQKGAEKRTMKKFFKSKTFLGAVLSIALCVSLIAGATFAIFTSEANVNIAVTSGTVKVTAKAENEQLYSYNNIDITTLTGEKVTRTMEEGFLAGGTAMSTDGKFTLTNLVPGDGITFDIAVENLSNVDIQYHVVIKSATVGDLMEALKVTVNGKAYSGNEIDCNWTYVKAGAEIASVPVEIELPLATNNDWQAKKVEFTVMVEAYQGNAKTTNVTTTIETPEEGKEASVVSDAIAAAKAEAGVKSITMNVPKKATVSLENGVMNYGANSTETLRTATFVGELDENGQPVSAVDVVTNATTAEGGELNYQRGSSFVFKNLTIQAGEGSFDGIVCDELTYENCVIKGKLTLYGKATFINCTFENDMADQYSIWTWGGTDVKFEGCTFNTNGKAILLYGQATAANPTNLVVNNCTFNDRNNGVAGKAAIEIGNDYNATYTLTVNNATVNGFAINEKGENTNTTLWGNKNSMDAEHLTVIIDGVKVK